MNHMDAVRSSAAERYLLDEMSEPERFAFEEHYFDCLECAEDVRAGAAMRSGVRAGLLQPRQAIPIAAGRRRTASPSTGWRSATVLPWAAAAVLALAVGYQSLAPAGQLGPQALTPFTLRPESRGAVPVIPISEGSSAVTLAVDVVDAGAGELEYELRTDSDESVASGRVAAPAAGMPLLMLVPVWTLHPSGHYILSVRRAADRELLGEYRFAVAAQP